jgi:hypothetical protein
MWESFGEEVFVGPGEPLLRGLRVITGSDGLFSTAERWFDMSAQRPAALRTAALYAALTSSWYEGLITLVSPPSTASWQVMQKGVQGTATKRFRPIVS